MFYDTCYLLICSIKNTFRVPKYDTLNLPFTVTVSFLDQIQSDRKERNNLHVNFSLPVPRTLLCQEGADRSLSAGRSRLELIQRISFLTQK